jgi:nicotinamidase-related amidase
MDTDAKLHDWHIAPREYARQESRRGRRHAFETLNPPATALVVVDMVPFFVDQSAYCRGIVPNINALATALRAAGGTVAWVLPSPHPRHPDLARAFFGPVIAETYRLSGGTGPLPARLAPTLASAEADIFVEKSAASAFLPGYCDLPDMLAARTIDTVLIAGTVTNVCCESSARDASSTGFRTILLADASAARTDAEHNATLHTIYRTFGDVRPTAEVLALIAATGRM